MKLFNKYQSRALQFALDLLAQLQSTVHWPSSGAWTMPIR